MKSIVDKNDSMPIQETGRMWSGQEGVGMNKWLKLVVPLHVFGRIRFTKEHQIGPAFGAVMATHFLDVCWEEQINSISHKYVRNSSVSEK